MGGERRERGGGAEETRWCDVRRAQPASLALKREEGTHGLRTGSLQRLEKARNGFLQDLDFSPGRPPSGSWPAELEGN